MDVEVYLYQIRNITDEITRKELQLEDFVRLASSVQGVNYNRVSASETLCKDAPFVKWVVKQIEVEEEVKNLKVKLDVAKFELLEMLGKLESINHMKLLKLRYYDLLSWDKISEEMNYSKRWVHKIHNDAITKFKELKKIPYDVVTT